MIIDTHCHLNDPSLYQKRAELINNALSFGVNKMICVGFDYPSSLLAVQIAHEYEGIVYAAVGIHPSETLKANNDDLNKLENLLKDELVIGLGEIGLDFHFDDVPEDIQSKYFIEQIELADKYNKPIIIHMRDASNATLNILYSHKEYLNNGGIIHCYSGSKEQVSEFCKLGMYISFGGPLTFLNSKTPKESILAVPENRLLFETDSPYLSPHPLRGKENEPANVMLVVNEASKLLNKTAKELEIMEEKNFHNLFNI